jgi:hypothetical protein
MVSSIRVVYDGWLLIREKTSPAALHLLAILAHLPEGVSPLVAIPEEAPVWFPESIKTQVAARPNTEFARSNWEQRVLPRLARQADADLLHLVVPRGNLLGNQKTLISPSGFAQENDFDSGFGMRLREALGTGGLARANGLLWPSDLKEPQGSSRIFKLPPTVHPDFQPASEPVSPSIKGLDLPENYVLYHGPTNAAALRRLLSAWTWGAGSIGEYYPLLLLGLNAGPRAYIQSLLPSFNLGGSVRVLPEIAPTEVPALYRGSSAVYHLGETSAWGGSLRHALVCSRPIAGLRAPLADAIAGQAAYLVEGDERSLGSAFIAVVIKEAIYENLIAAARERTRGWQSSDYGGYLLNVYKAVLEIS